MIFKCKMCGGSLEIQPGSTVCECEYCGTQQTLPKLADDKRANLYDRANHFRRNNEFDKAMGIYEQILNEDQTDAEAYWSLVLCRYGIEYVEDPATHKRLPTVNRAQYTSIFADEDYKAAVSHADIGQKSVYEAEAKAIDEIQKGILEISAKEEPFDVFICYKETDANGRRTQDSVLANDLYHQLTQEGFKVFFARITLEDKLGSAYEPYIFAALNSAKVMVVLGTKPEYFSAVWVKNEWSRYLALIKNGAKKVLIPAYRDMDPYDLPEEFSHLQAQDMSKLGFMQDLIRGIKKLTAEEKAAPVRETVVVQNSAPAGNVAPLLKRGYMALEDGNWQEADSYFERVLDQDAENVKAYLGKLFASERVPNTEALQKKHLAGLNDISPESLTVPADQRAAEQLRQACPIAAAFDRTAANNALTRIDRAYSSSVSSAQKALSAAETYWRNSRFYNRALQFAAGAEKTEVQAVAGKVIGAYKDRLEKEKQAAEQARTARQTSYDKAVTAETEKQKRIYAERLQKLYETALEKERAASSEGSYRHAAGLFEQLVGYKDSEQRVKDCRAREEAARRAQREKEEAEARAKKRKKVLTVTILLLLAALAALYIFVLKPAQGYSVASALMDSGKYEEAKAAFTALGTYKDSADMVRECNYQAAKALFDGGKYEEAKAAFTALGTYKDSADNVLECDYQPAKALLEKKDYAGAAAIFIHLKGYKDVDALLASDDNLKVAALDAAWQPGKYVTFGRYEQDNNKSNGAEAIEWLVLARNGSKALILSKYGLEAKPYNEKCVDITWEKCTLRAWLNGEFLNTAFDGTEQARIQQTAVDNGKAQGYSKWNTNGGNDTQDKVFLLSYAEANKYLGVTYDNDKNREARVSPTAYADANGAPTASNIKTAEGENAVWWWLRSPGVDQRSASSVGSGGSLLHRSVNGHELVVRPALWVEIS